jgi:hypothetical protein
MGSIEVYDVKEKKWVPYVPDFAKWERHFKDISEGRVRPDHKGRYIVGSGSRSSTTETRQPTVKLVTPVAQAIEMAKSDLEREKHRAPTVIRDGATGRNTKATKAKKRISKGRSKSKAKKRKYNDQFAK